MKTVWILLGLVVLLLGAAVLGYMITENRLDRPDASATPTVSATATPDDKIIIDQPKPGSSIGSPLKITGRARGTWFFEASFPVELTDQDGTVIAQTAAQAKGDWMTSDWVPFEATITFPKQISGESGTLVVRKDNPSGLPANDDSRTVPIFF